MRARDFLIEYDQARTLTGFGEKLKNRIHQEWIVSHADPSLPNSVSDEMVRRHLRSIENADPTNKKAFVLELLRMYLDGSMKRIEDVSKATAPLKLYAKFKNRGLTPLRNLSFDQLLDLGDDLSGVLSQTDESRAEAQALFDSGAARLLVDNEKFKVVIPETEEAAKVFGRGTRWCTAAEENNAFESYAQNGPLYIVMFKGQAGKKWQLSCADAQFMDARDDYLTKENWFAETDFVNWFANNVMLRSIENYFQQQGLGHTHRRSPWDTLIRYFPDPDAIDEKSKSALVDHDPNRVLYFKNITPNMVQKVLNTTEYQIKRLIGDMPGPGGGMIQIEAIRELGLGFCVPDDVRYENIKAYDEIVRAWFAKATELSAQSTGFHLPYVGQYAVNKGLCGKWARAVQEGVNDSGK
jgi:hypothetical protein